MSDTHFDAIVIGAGGMGSAAMFELTRRGRRVLGLEQFSLGHRRGSSHGRTRIIRRAYFEHPDYVPLVRRSFDRWYDLEQHCGLRLLTECDCLCVGPPNGEVVPGVLKAAHQHGLTVESLDAIAMKTRYPTLRVPETFVGALEQDAGILAVEECVWAHREQAERMGAEIRSEEPVLEWQPVGDGVSVRTEKHTYHAARLIVTAGPWAARVLADLHLPLTLMRQVQLWVGTQDDARFRRDRFPIIYVEDPECHFYAMPVIGPEGMKIARHYGAPEVHDPSEINLTVNDADVDAIRPLIRTYLPEASGPLRHAEGCIYTLTQSRHFLIDQHPEHPQVCLAAGFSGHGFKFAPVVGEALADLAEHGTTSLPIEMFALDQLHHS